MQRMAHGWDSYFNNLPPLSSDARTLRQTSESEGSLSQQLETFIGHHDFSNTVGSHEVPATNSNFNTNYYSNPTTGNSSSDCVYQRYYREMPWQGDGEQMEKDYLPTCGNSDISDFATDGLSTSGSFPSSFATDLQGLKQDCGILTTSFLEDYSDVSSCSDGDAGETRPSCKFMTNSVPKPKTDVSTKHHSSEWLFSDTGHMMFPTDSLCSTMSETNAILTSPSNVKVRENTAEYLQSKMEKLGHNQSSLTSSTVSSAGSETVMNKNDTNVFQGQKPKAVQRDITQRDLSISGHGNLTGDGIDKCSEQEQVSATAPNIMNTFTNEEDHLDEKVLSVEPQESFTQENEAHDDLNPTDDPNKKDTKVSGSLENETLTEKNASNPNFADGQDENAQADCTEKEIKSDTSQHSDSLGIKLSDSKDGTLELSEGTSKLEINSHDVECSLQSCENIHQVSIPKNTAVVSDGNLSNASDAQEQNVTSYTESCSQSHRSCADINPSLQKDKTDMAVKITYPPTFKSNGSGDISDMARQSVFDYPELSLQADSSGRAGIYSCLEKELTDPAARTNATSFADAECSNPTVTCETNEQSVSSCVESQLQPNTSSQDCQEKGMISPPFEKTTTSSTDPDCSGPGVDSNTNEQGVSYRLKPSLQSKASRTDVNPSLKKEWKSPSDNTNATSSPDPDCSGPGVASNTNEQGVSYRLKPSLQSKASRTDVNPSLKKEWKSPSENTNATSSPDQQPSLHQSPVALGPQSLGGDVAENTRESHEEYDTSTEEQSELGMLYGEPLSGEESSCDTDEPKLEEERNSVDPSEGQHPHLKSSRQMRKHLHPVVVLERESGNGMINSYHCGDCQHTTHDVDDLIKHHHCSHSVHNFQLCVSCNLYLMGNEHEGHLCFVTKEIPQLPSDSSIKRKRKRYGRHRCTKCKLIFSKLVQYISHMRIHTGTTPYKCVECGLYFAQAGTLKRHQHIRGRCKPVKPQVTNSVAVTSEKHLPVIEMPPQEDLDKPNTNLNKPYANKPKCYVKLVDISKTNLCSLCGKCFLTAEKAKKHFCTIHKEQSLAALSNKCTTKVSSEKTQKVQNEIRGKHKCPLCPRLFKYSYNRARHLRDCVRDAVLGGKEKVAGKYQCPLCHATFTQASNRYRHIKTSCLRECLNRLAKEKAKLRLQDEQNKTSKSEQKTQSSDNEQKTQSKENEQKTRSKENEQKTQSKENEQKSLSKENEQKRQPQATTAITTYKTVPRYKCNLCPAVFCYASGKYRHMKKHELFKLTGKMFRYRNSVFSTMSKPATLSSAKTEDDKHSLDSDKTESSPALACHFCGKCFCSSQSLKKHERGHRGDRPYRCLECGRGFKKRAHLIGHKIVHQKRIQCTVCKKILPTIGELIQHRSSHHKKGMLQCPDCPLQFQYPAHLLRHLDTHKSRRNKAPQLEGRSPLKTPPPQQCSESKLTGPRQVQCSLCKEVFDDAQVLRKHCLTHISGSSSNQCPFCKHYFNNRRYLLRHMIKHTGDKPFSCANCGKQFYRDSYLKLHSETCLPAQTTHPLTMQPSTKTKRPHVCSYCPRTFSKKLRLTSHLRGHKTNTLLLCSRCGQYFGFRKLNQHQRNCGDTTQFNTGSRNGNISKSTSQTNQTVHKMPVQSNATKILQFKCSHCTQRFRYRSLLLRHLVSHTGVQPYACMHCGHRYASQTMCLQHEAFCDGVYKEGPSKVKKSVAAGNLASMPTLRETAQKQGDGEADFKCKFCTKTFMKSRNLRRHILTHNEVKPYRCKACDSCFSRYDHLKVHQTRCKGRRQRLEVCIPKISLDDVGKGWQNRLGTDPVQKPETFDCKDCSRSFSAQSKLSRHVTMFHATKLFKCTRCGSSFTHEKSLKKHKKLNKCRRVSNEPMASVPQCVNPTENVTKPFQGVRNRILQSIKPCFNKKFKFVCSYCPRTFGTGWQLGVHTRLHTGEKPYACEYCGERFIRKDYVQRHFAKCTKKQQQRQVLCKRCGGFFSKFKIESHQKNCTLTPSSSESTVCQSQQSVSSPPKNFSCAYCSSRFLIFSQLQEHFLNAHKLETVVPPVSTATLQHHLSNIPHIKEEPLDEMCDEQISAGANFICKLDTAVRFPCPECNMSFASKAGLSGHLRVHSMDHPFSCKICKRGFWNKSLLRNHYRKCRFGHISESSTTQQLEAPLKAQIDFALNDSVLVFKEGPTATGTGVLQTNFSCKDDLMDEYQQNSEEDHLESSSSNEKKAMRYQCSECDKSFTDGLLLISHLEDHGRQEQEKKRNTCTKCGRVCTSQGNLEKHMKMHGQNYPCPDCPKIVYSLSDFKIHKTYHDPNRPYVCKLCNQRFWTRPALCNHYGDDHPDDVFTCRFCNKKYSVKKSLTRHYKKWHQKEQRDLASVSQEKSNIEQTSSQVSTTGESDEDENNSSEDSDSDSAPYFPCHVCGKTFTTSESLEDHQRCHLGEKPHECEECGRCFFQASQLQQHQRMHKSEFQCQACGRGFVSLFALRKHKHTHGKSRPYRCTKCDLSFTGPSQLAEHMTTHREENFPCDICNRVFLSKSSRAEHRKCHSKSDDHPSPSASQEEHEKSPSSSEHSSEFTKELKYRCGVCNDRFRDPEELSEHGCLAAKERPYSCSDCNKHFLHASHLKKHKATHQLSRSVSGYPCNQCNSSFSSSQDFLSHLKIHVGTTAETKHITKDTSLSFTCPVCQQCFVCATELIDHFTVHLQSPLKCKVNKPEEHDHQLKSTTEFECTECGQSFLGSDSFRQHHCSCQQRTTLESKYSNPPAKASPPTHYQAAGDEEDVDVTGEDLFNCPHCSMQFPSKSGLLEHQNKQHQNDKRFKCELCGKTFALRRYLKEHERRHRLKFAAENVAQVAENKFKCTQCRIDFSSTQDLSLHMRQHAEKEVGDYRCDMCYKSFSHWSLLKQHQESHMGQVVYECTECDKAFAFPHLLEEHQQTHASYSH